MDMMERIEQFLAANKFAVAGASVQKEKYGNKVVRALLQNQRQVLPINPKEKSVEGVAAFPDVGALPEDVDAISIVTPPAVSVSVVNEALKKGIVNFWFQPGAEHPDAVQAANAAGANVIADGSCILVALRYRE